MKKLDAWQQLPYKERPEYDICDKIHLICQKQSHWSETNEDNSACAIRKMVPAYEY